MNGRIWGIIGGLALVLALLSPYVLGSTKKVERLFEEAETLYEQNDYEGAITKYSEALKESKKPRAKAETIDEDFTTLVNLKISMSYVQLAEHENNARYYEKALEYIEKAAQTVTLLEYEERLTYRWGYILYKIGQLEQALEKLTQLIEKFPNSPFVEKAQETIAQINAQLPDRAENEDGVYPTDTTPPWTNDLSKFEAFNKERNQRLVVPNRLRAEKEFAQAAEKYETFAIDYPATKQAAYALYWAGFCYSPDSTSTLSDKSITIFRKLIANYPESFYAAKASEKLKLIPNGDLEDTIRKAEEAVQHLKALNCQSPAVDTAERYLESAKQEKARNNYEGAYQQAKNAEELAKNATEAHKKAEQYVKAGYSRLRQGELNRAKANVDAARSADPSYPKIMELSKEIERTERKNNHFRRGVVYFENKAYAQAIDSLTKALKIDSQFKEAYHLLGAAYLRNGEFECALECARKALAIDPNYQDANDLINSIDIDTLSGECEHDIP